MKILITGGAGFIGSHTTERLVRAGHQVHVIDNLSTGKLANLKAVEGEVEFEDLDIRDFESVGRAMSGIDAVIHLAAVSSVFESIEDPVGTHDVNVSGCVKIMEAARREGVRRVIMASSAAVYGDHPELPKTEGSPTQPLSPYAWHKLSGEFYGRFYGDTYGTEFVALRYFNVYGTRQDPSSPYSGVLSIFRERALQDQPLMILGDGEQTRDFIHVSDVAEINRLTVESDWPLPMVVNVATGRETRIIDAAGIVQKAAGSNAGLTFGQPRQGDIYRSLASNDLLVKVLGYKPRVTVETGLEELVRSGE